MLPIIRRARWKARVPRRGAMPSRPYATTSQSEQTPSHSSARTSKTRTFNWSSTVICAFCIVCYTDLYLQDKFKPSNIVTSLYHRLKGAPLQPSYSPLRTADEIRLLVLEPGKGKEAIRCRLKHVLLADGPKYEALSYVWGRCPPFFAQDYIYCDGGLVKVGSELFNALGSLRLPDRERTIWADALCINQGDNVEKGMQVRIMGDIYAGSQQVLIWLGKDTRQTAGVFNSLREVDREFKRVYKGYEEIPLSRFVTLSAPGLSEADLQRLVCRYDWESLLQLARHPWFRRVWTLQEAARAPAATMVQGEHSIAASEFFRPLSCMVHAVASAVVPQDSGAILGHRKATDLGNRIFDNNGFENLSDSQPRPYLYMVASNSPKRVATDPRDRIYAFHGVSTDHDFSDAELLPDYDASVEEVYSRFARWCLLTKKDMTYLVHAGLPGLHEGGPPPGPTADVPSWVADWTRKERPHLDSYFTLTAKPFQAGSALSPTVSWDPTHPRQLSIKGRVVDTVTELSVTREDLTRYYKLLVRLSQGHAYRIRFQLELNRLLPATRHIAQGLHEAHQAVSTYGPTKGPAYLLEEVTWIENCKAIATQGLDDPIPPARFEPFWRAMLRDRTLWGEEKAPLELGREFGEYLHFLDLVRHGEFWPSLQPAMGMGPGGTSQLEREPTTTSPAPTAAVLDSDSPAIQTVRLHLAQISHRRFCATAKGRLGWVPDCARPGDLVCVFDGATVPFVIRPRTKEQTEPGLLSFASRYRRVSPPVEAEADPEYVLVGECYLHGLMDGEVLACEDLKSGFIVLS